MAFQDHQNDTTLLSSLSRYFKQIVKSARANGTAGPTEDHTDDFLGCLNIPIRVCGEGWWVWVTRIFDECVGMPQSPWASPVAMPYDPHRAPHSLGAGGGGLHRAPTQEC